MLKGALQQQAVLLNGAADAAGVHLGQLLRAALQQQPVQQAGQQAVQCSGQCS
jgi:hypothetical protein